MTSGTRGLLALFRGEGRATHDVLPCVQDAVVRRVLGPSEPAARQLELSECGVEVAASGAEESGQQSLVAVDDGSRRLPRSDAWKRRYRLPQAASGGTTSTRSIMGRRRRRPGHRPPSRAIVDVPADGGVAASRVRRAGEQRGTGPGRAAWRGQAGTRAVGTPLWVSSSSRQALMAPTSSADRTSNVPPKETASVAWVRWFPRA